MVESFDTWEQALARMEEREQAANARVTPEQRSISRRGDGSSGRAGAVPASKAKPAER